MNVGQMASYDTAKEMITEAQGPGMTTNLASAGVSEPYTLTLTPTSLTD